MLDHLTKIISTDIWDSSKLDFLNINVLYNLGFAGWWDALFYADLPERTHFALFLDAVLNFAFALGFWEVIFITLVTMKVIQMWFTESMKIQYQGTLESF